MELVDYDLNFETVNKTTVLILSYKLKLDKRIAENNATLTKIAHIINSTLLMPDSLIYRDLISNFNKSVSFILPDFIITRKFTKQSSHKIFQDKYI